jgi:hypothetical protein
MIAQAIQLTRSLVYLTAIYLAAQILGIIGYHGGEILRLYELRGHVIIPDELTNDIARFTGEQ